MLIAYALIAHNPTCMNHKMLTADMATGARKTNIGARRLTTTTHYITSILKVKHLTTARDYRKVTRLRLNTTTHWHIQLSPALALRRSDTTCLVHCVGAVDNLIRR